MTPQDWMTLGIVAVATLVLVIGLALLFAREEPQPEPKPDRTYTRDGAAKYSHHRKTCRRK